MSLSSISFQDGVRRSTVVVRQPFRSSKRIMGTGVRRRGLPHLTRGWSRWSRACCSLFLVMKGRNKRGDDHSRLDRLEVSLGAG
jgi:hypothetical protein